MKFELVIPSYPWRLSDFDAAHPIGYCLEQLGHAWTIERDAVTDDAKRIAFAAQLGLYELGPLDVIYQDVEPESFSPRYRDTVIERARVGLVWESSPNRAAFYTAGGVPVPPIVPIGYVPELQRDGTRNRKEVDVLLLGAHSERRAELVTALRIEGLSVALVDGAFGSFRDHLIDSARVNLNVHASVPTSMEWKRIAFLMHRAALTVSERPAIEGELVPDGFETFAFDELVAQCKRLAGDARAADDFSYLQRKAWRSWPMLEALELALSFSFLDDEPGPETEPAPADAVPSVPYRQDKKPERVDDGGEKVKPYEHGQGATHGQASGKGGAGK